MILDPVVSHGWLALVFDKQSRFQGEKEEAKSTENFTTMPTRILYIQLYPQAHHALE